MKKFHILIIRFSSLGDIVLTSSLVSSFKFIYGDKVHLSYLTSTGMSSVVEGHNDIDSVYAFSRTKGLKGLKELYKFVSRIDKKHSIDLILDMHCTIRSLFIRLVFWKIPRVFIDKRTFERWMLTTFKIDLFSKKKSIRKENFKGGELLLERNVRDFSFLLKGGPNLKDLSQDIISKELSIMSAEKAIGQLSSCSVSFEESVHFKFSKWNLDELNKKPYICIVPSASYPEKRWPTEKFIGLLKLFLKSESFDLYRFIILAGPSDSFCDQFNELCLENSSRVFNLQGKTTIKESTFFLKKADFCIGNDTGLPHLSESVGTPALFILGPTGEQFGFYPHLDLSRFVSKRIWCRPCTTNGKGHCIRSERFCLSTINEKDVFQEALMLRKELN